MTDQSFNKFKKLLADFEECIRQEAWESERGTMDREDEAHLQADQLRSKLLNQYKRKG